MFLKYFQDNLASNIKELLKEFNAEHLYVSTEDVYLPGTFNGIMDLCIYDKNNLDRIVALEIEHISNYEQAKRNIDKMKEWTHRSYLRQCSLLHIFNVESNLTSAKVNELVSYAKLNQQKNNGFFYYDFIYYSVTDKRTTSKTAEELVLCSDFKTKIWILLKEIDLLR